MPVNNKWSNVSFTPDGQKPVFFAEVIITFPSITDMSDSNASDNPEDSTGPIGIRIAPLAIGAIAIFPVGQIGTFQGTWLVTQCIYSAINAKVYLSKQEVLVLEANSVDNFTHLVSVSYSD